MRTRDRSGAPLARQRLPAGLELDDAGLARAERAQAAAERRAAPEQRRERQRRGDPRDGGREVEGERRGRGAEEQQRLAGGAGPPLERRGEAQMTARGGTRERHGFRTSGSNVDTWGGAGRRPRKRLR